VIGDHDRGRSTCHQCCACQAKASLPSNNVLHTSPRWPKSLVNCRPSIPSAPNARPSGTSDCLPQQLPLVWSDTSLQRHKFAGQLGQAEVNQSFPPTCVALWAGSAQVTQCNRLQRCTKGEHHSSARCLCAVNTGMSAHACQVWYTIIAFCH